MITPTLPSVERGMVKFLRDKTLAGDKVYAPEEMPRAPKAPYLVVTWEGDIQEQHNTVIPTGRITTDFYGRTSSQGKYGARQIREALLTPGDATGGVHAVFNYYEPEEDESRLITLSGAALESGPREGPEERERIITTYLVDYY